MWTTTSLPIQRSLVQEVLVQMRGGGIPGSKWAGRVAKCVFITAVPITKLCALFAWGGGEGGGHCAARGEGAFSSTGRRSEAFGTGFASFRRVLRSGRESNSKILFLGIFKHSQHFFFIFFGVVLNSETKLIFKLPQLRYRALLCGVWFL